MIRYVIIAALFLTLASCASDQQKAEQSAHAYCTANNSLPDFRCTPGAIFPNATIAQICAPGYSQSVRNVLQSVKDKVYEEYGVAKRLPGEYKIDHLVPLEIGGSNDIKNLWPEAAAPKPGFHEKDQVENYLHDQVCSGKTSLKDAQAEISTNWKIIVIN